MDAKTAPQGVTIARDFTVNGAETLAVRALAAELGRRLGREPEVTGAEAGRAAARGGSR